jgi:methylglutaconyl-CoA hydratase
MTSQSEWTVSSKSSGDTAVVTFSHVKGNSLPGDLIKKLTLEIKTLAGATVNSIVLASEGEAFCGGVNLTELKGNRSESAAVEFFSNLAELYCSIIESPKLIIARVQGHAVGGGVGLLAAADYVLAVSAAKYRLPELEHGLAPWVISPLLERRIGAAGFSAMAIDREWRDSDWARARGLIDRCSASPLDLDTDLESVVAGLAKVHRAAAVSAKRLFWLDSATRGGGLRSELMLRAKEGGRLWASVK